MSDQQQITLCMMFVVGMVGFLLFESPNNSKKLRIAGGVWAVVWCFPPMAMLWIKGVFG